MSETTTAPASTFDTEGTAHAAGKRFTVYDLRAARKHYSAIIAANATEADVTTALLARALVSTSSSNGKAAYYASLTASATDATRALAEGAFAASLAESDARRAPQATPEDGEDEDL